ncbi:hypothetical protein BDY19DRAFT_939993 [Irpex rosettiformis]|uniref:Uncharacterized protein n=1 Tax=Irpex rosettiformis TaxID=378272 RepID=A0ACB8U7P3_9APHY|nr:hypothetical protein BDY19DRAFT_939993 [Irpex rosettiformis]
MASIASWFGANSYSTWNRTIRLQTTPYLARVDTPIARRATTMAQQQQDAVVINMEPNTNPNEPTSNTNSKKKQDTLFGPNIGIVARGPEWTESREKVIDELTPEIVKTWIAKSKQGNQPTTTLQALVNLKRPSLRLTPLEVAASDDPEHVDSQHHHGLEFEYDCDAPKCAITVHVFVSPSHHLADKASAGGHSKTLVFEATTAGGFGKTLTLEEGATLELGRYEHRPSSKLETTPKDEAAASSSTPPPAAAPAPSLADETPAADAHRKKRFTAFHFRRKSTQERAVAGPALAVVDAETKEEDKGEGKEDHDDVGVKAMIKLSALDENGKPLPCVNEQTTYLHVVRFGAQPPAEEQDKRPWVVKVVKREATIGAHTFHLHEIYGLSSSSSNANHHTQPLPSTYPPTSAPGNTFDDEPSSECLLCLSAPREVVLLPCRHLVACRDCAINMIEFGAGGQITQATEPEPTTTGAEGEASTAGETPAGETTAVAEGSNAATTAPAVVTTPPTTTTAPRRKRKAKGWFCPVCRQPYTSCLRITTTPPSKDLTDDEHADSVDIADHPPTSASPPVPQPAPAAALAPSRTGFASLVRPNFLRSLSRPQASDLERGTAAVPAASS